MINHASASINPGRRRRTIIVATLCLKQAGSTPKSAQSLSGRCFINTADRTSRECIEQPKKLCDITVKALIVRKSDK
ncbi:hypothetical protein PV328_005054 [Microctonus aethiopoides]|uniref:Uncharacterized protein n=1 Tax=Microctonus aethiopoides TaxID=144406 RepID=A0AA39KRW4_9HYME|nr:hypothetical protein PV328_005054 [Microctonus aethiopoides]